MKGGCQARKDVTTADKPNSVQHKVSEDAPADTAPGTTESQQTVCKECWKNAHADREGRKVVVFDETGIFAISYHHDTVMLVEDMHQSGELYVSLYHYANP